MNPQSPTPSPPRHPDNEVLIQRRFAAPRTLVWKAWTDVAHLLAWHAPQGCEIHFARFDFREGGGFHSRISTPTIGDCWCVATYVKIIEPRRLVYTMAVADSAGNKVKSTTAGHDASWPEETTVTVTLEEVDGGTQLTLHQTVSEDLAKRTGAYPSWLQMFDRLEQRVAV